jgi:hypothetical protein
MKSPHFFFYLFVVHVILITTRHCSLKFKIYILHIETVICTQESWRITASDYNCDNVYDNSGVVVVYDYYYDDYDYDKAPKLDSILLLRLHPRYNLTPFTLRHPTLGLLFKFIYGLVYDVDSVSDYRLIEPNGTSSMMTGQGWIARNLRKI